jgi:heme-degrading monooxygenase HmoA
MLVSVTRLRLRSWRFLLPFAIEAARSRRQAEGSPGCVGALVRKTQGLAFWTLTFWEDGASLRAFMLKSPHHAAMPKLAHWCDEAAVAHWEHGSAVRPGWSEAAEKLAAAGRLSRVKRPSARHLEGRIGVD